MSGRQQRVMVQPIVSFVDPDRPSMELIAYHATY